MERQEGRASSTFRHVMPVDEGEDGIETVMDLKKLRKHQRQKLVDRGAALLSQALLKLHAHSILCMAALQCRFGEVLFGSGMVKSFQSKAKVLLGLLKLDAIRPSLLGLAHSMTTRLRASRLGKIMTRHYACLCSSADAGSGQ